jgi:hypothetical protein
MLNNRAAIGCQAERRDLRWGRLKEDDEVGIGEKRGLLTRFFRVVWMFWGVASG